MVNTECHKPFQTKDVPDLTGYVAIVTGGNSGIGYAITLAIATAGARVYIAARNLTKISQAISETRGKLTRSGQELDIRALELDLQALHSVRKCAGEFERLGERLDLLINNAGIMATPYTLTEDNFDTQFQTNYLAPFYLIQLLTPLLLSTAEKSGKKGRVRVVSVTSDAAFSMGPKALDLETPGLEYEKGSMAPWKRYGHSKLAEIVYMKAFKDRYSTRGISAYSASPGIVSTNLQSGASGLLGAVVGKAVKWGVMPGSHSSEDGARSILFCATGPEAVANGGKYFVPYGKVGGKAEEVLKDGKVAEELWRASERWVREAGF